MSLILTLNAGSSSIKFAVYRLPERAGGVLQRQAHGQIEGIGQRACLHAEGLDWPLSAADAPHNHAHALQAILRWLREHLPQTPVVAVSHRVVHGGSRRTAPTPLTSDVMDELRALVPLAPLHQPHNLSGIEAAQAAFPDAMQVACFDTAFHRQHGFVADTFALPRRYYDEGVRRYGFHGLSYEFIAQHLQAHHPELHAGRVVVAHLGNGASMCALLGGRSVASTMGFTALDGLPMGTRCGQIDPGVLLYLMDAKGMSAAQITRLLYSESGLKGLSGLSNDVRTLEAAGTPEAADALNYFAEHARRAIGALATTIGGLDALVFTGGIGEHGAAMRQRIAAPLAWMGVQLDEAANATHQTRISAADSRVQVLVLPTDEEGMLARHAREWLDAA